MLVLSRKKGERIVIGEGDDACIVEVVEIRGDKVRLGLTARRDMPIHRSEVLERIKAEQEGSPS